METVKNGKGDWKRPVDPRKWAAGYDQIKWKSRPKSRKPRTTKAPKQ